MKSSLFSPDEIRHFFDQNIWDMTSLSTICDDNSIRFPTKEAVVDSKTRLTWADLKKKSDQLALGLKKMGFNRDDILVSQLYNCVELYVLIVACQKAGLILATVTYNFREASLIPILRHIQARGAIIPRMFRSHDFHKMYAGMKEHVPSLEHIIVIGSDMPRHTISYDGLSSTPVTDEDLKTIGDSRIPPYDVSRIGTTGGTTGVPKLTERIESSRMPTEKNIAERWELTENDSIGAFYNLTGGTPKICLGSAPMVGARIVLAEHPSTEDFCEIVAREKVTVACIVPTQLVRILDYPHLDRYDLRSIRIIANSTDMLPYELGARAEKKFNCRYVNSYGASDTGGLSATSTRDPKEVRLGSVGRPYTYAVVKVVDEEGKELPPGEVGDVIVKKGPLSSGYFKNPQLNDEVWGTGWFHLNETGRFNSDGNLTLVGRKRNVIKRGGQRIAPRDIEEIIMRHPNVRVVAVVGMPDAEMGQKVCAYIVPKPNTTVGLDDIAAFMESQKATPFLIPQRVEVIAEMPVVVTGQKVDRQWLERDIANKLEQETAARH